MSDERRTTPRIEVSTAVRVETARSIRRFQSLNLSTGGIYLEGDKPLPIGSELRIKFELPEAGKVEAQGVVKHHNPLIVDDGMGGQRRLIGMGIAFVRVEGQGSQALAEAIKKLTLRSR